MKTGDLRQAILATLAYSDLFDYPLRVEEVHQYLYGLRADLARVREGLRFLVTEGEVGETSSCYFLRGRDGIVEAREVKEEASRLKMEKVRRLSPFLAFLPSIELLGVTGTLAVHNSSSGDDIDLMIITSPRRLWLTRLLAVFLLKMSGDYRSSHKIKDQFCPNLWLSRDALSFEERNLYTARELCQMVPLMERENCYREILAENLWVKDFLPNWEGGFLPQSLAHGVFPLGRVGDFLDRLAYLCQRYYMARKKTTEKVAYSRAFFHPQDVSTRILASFYRLQKTEPPDS